MGDVCKGVLLYALIGLVIGLVSTELESVASVIIWPLYMVELFQ